MHRYLKKQEFYWFPLIYKSKGLEEDIQPQNIGKLRIMIMKKNKKIDRMHVIQNAQCENNVTLFQSHSN